MLSIHLSKTAPLIRRLEDLKMCLCVVLGLAHKPLATKPFEFKHMMFDRHKQQSLFGPRGASLADGTSPTGTT